MATHSPIIPKQKFYNPKDCVGKVVWCTVVKEVVLHNVTYPVGTGFMAMVDQEAKLKTLVNEVPIPEGTVSIFSVKE